MTQSQIAIDGCVRFPRTVNIKLSKACVAKKALQKYTRLVAAAAAAMRNSLFAVVESSGRGGKKTL